MQISGSVEKNGVTSGKHRSITVIHTCADKTALLKGIVDNSEVFPPACQTPPVTPRFSRVINKR